MGGEERDEDGVRVLSCQKLCEVIKVIITRIDVAAGLTNNPTNAWTPQEVYASKSKFDKKCIDSRLPRETMVPSLRCLFFAPPS